jgi:hypothetical protein
MCVVTWISPRQDNIKVNVDESSFNNSIRPGSSGILRDSNGIFIGIFTSLCVELHAVLNGLKIAQAEGFHSNI